MKVALIPPHGALSAFGQGEFHLLLSHLLEDHRYMMHYLRQRESNAYLVLDNSAHEMGAGQSAKRLAEEAYMLNAQEVVVPDVLEDADATVQAAVTALETWYEVKRGRSLMRELSPALMYVPQAQYFLQWVDCLDELIRIHRYMARHRDFREDFVIGISKDYESWLPEEGLISHLQHVQELRHKHKFQVHLLGWGRNLWMLERYAREFPWIRSTDSAKPFVYGLAGVDLTQFYTAGITPKYPTRPENYFSKRVHQTKKYICERNVHLFRALATGNVEAVMKV